MRAWIGLGANLGDPASTFADALRRIDRLPHADVRRVSSLWRTAPVDAAGPEFHNAAAELDVRCPPQKLMDDLLRIETALGRTRPFHHAPRTIDLDFLLAVGDNGAPVRIDSVALRLPHPRLHERAFALAPLAELEPALDVPDRGNVTALLKACEGQRIERMAALYPGLPGEPP